MSNRLDYSELPESLVQNIKISAAINNADINNQEIDKQLCRELNRQYHDSNTPASQLERRDDVSSLSSLRRHLKGRCSH